MIIREEHYNRLKDDTSFPNITIKYPCYNTIGKMIGIFGCTITMGDYLQLFLAEALTVLTHSGLLTASPARENSYEVLSSEPTLSPRQVSCLYYLAKGLTDKQTAQH